MNRKKALIFCYDYHPLNTVAVNRISEWAKNFNEFGVYPIIVTRKWNTPISNFKDYYVEENGEIEIIENEKFAEFRIPNKLSTLEKINAKLTSLNWIRLRKINTLLMLLVRFLPGFNIEKNIYRKHFNQIQSTFNPDILIASGEPFILFKYAFHYHKKFKTPYILDYRDGWSTNITTQTGIKSSLNKIEAHFEKKFLQQAKHVTIASELLLSEISNKFQFKNISVIENGADLESIDEIIPNPDSNFTLVFTGTIYDTHNVLDFLDAFEKLISEKQAIVKFIGADYYARNKNVQKIKEMSEKYPENVLLTSRIPKKDALQIQKNAAVLLKFSSNKVIKGFYGAKLYEYACMNKTILNIVKNETHATTDFFVNEQIQTFAFSKETCYEKLLDLYVKWENKTLKSNFLSKDQINSISRKKQTELFANKIHGLL